MKNADRIRRAIQSLAKREGEEIYSIIATVVSIESDTCTVQPIDATAELSEIRLRPDSNDSAFYLIPTIGSTVIVSMTSDTEGFISMVSACDTVILRSTDVVQLNDGSKGGIPITSDLVTKLNTIEQDLNNLKTAFNTWIPVPNDGGAALKAALTSYISATITPTNNSDIENTKVTHGIS